MIFPEKRIQKVVFGYVFLPFRESGSHVFEFIRHARGGYGVVAERAVVVLKRTTQFVPVETAYLLHIVKARTPTFAHGENIFCNFSAEQSVDISVKFGAVAVPVRLIELL